jgi:hypothetical protein
MEIPALGCPQRKTLVVLGAGATRGASFAEERRLPPPLDLDFFQLLQMSETGRTAEGRELLDHVRAGYGPGLQVGMEIVFNNLDSAKTFYEKVRVDPGRVPQWPARLIDAFRAVLPQLLGETIEPTCAYHGALAYRLRTADAVVSLNYDCVIDWALIASAGSRFAASRHGYGIEVSNGAAEWQGRAPGPTPVNSVQLLKLHGSLNWAASGSPLQLRDSASVYQTVPEGVIQPPLTNKPVTNDPFNSIWQAARRAVRDMRRLIVIGYSMPPADGLVRALLTTDLSHTLEELVVVDPSADVRTRHIALFAGSSTRVFPFDSFRAFASALEV